LLYVRVVAQTRISSLRESLCRSSENF